MARVAVLKANGSNEYGFAETAEYDGTLSEYLAECDGVEIETCPADAEPVTHNCGGATILRVAHHDGGEQQNEDWYSYEAFLADEPAAINWRDLRVIDVHSELDNPGSIALGEFVSSATANADRAEYLAGIDWGDAGEIEAWSDWALVPPGLEIDDDTDLSAAIDGLNIDWTGCREAVEAAIAAHADEE